MPQTSPPAQIGQHLSEVDTPALLLDLDLFEQNIKTMTGSLADREIVFRPHAKTHKCPAAALRQIAAGAIGVCCQKVGEAEVMAYSGIKNILVTNQIVGAQKLRRLCALAKTVDIAVLADHPDQVAPYSAAAQEAGIELPVLVEINLGGDRCGIDPGEPAAELAKMIDAAPKLTFAGLQAYHGAAQHLRTPAERTKAIAQAVDLVNLTKTALTAAGLPCPTVTGAGTGTYLHEAASGVFTELQCGSYIFMDKDYAANLGPDGAPVGRFANALLVYVTVISRAAPTRAVVDAGHKTVPVDSGMPLVRNHPEIEYDKPSDEHGKLILPADSPLKIGDKLQLIPAHCDPTVNMFDWIVCFRGDRVEELWSVAARGCNR